MPLILGAQLYVLSRSVVFCAKKNIETEYVLRFRTSSFLSTVHFLPYGKGSLTHRSREFALAAVLHLFSTIYCKLNLTRTWVVSSHIFKLKIRYLDNLNIFSPQCWLFWFFTRYRSLVCTWGLIPSGCNIWVEGWWQYSLSERQRFIARRRQPLKLWPSPQQATASIGVSSH